MATDTIITPQQVLEPGEPLLATDLRHHTVDSELLGGSRQLVVFVPPGYEDEPQRRYPVLYMQDGQNLFDPATSYVPGKHWRMDQTADLAIREGRVEPVIIVGIYHACENRVTEYTPTKDAKRGGGRADLYARALIEVIKPFIDSTYRTLPCFKNTGIGGSSLGGLVSLYLGLEHPNVFGRVAAMSPSAWWDRRTIVRLARQQQPKPRLSIWLDTGTREGVEALLDVRNLRDAFENQGWNEGMDLNYMEAVGGVHDEAAWAARVRPMLKFLFPPKGLIF